jgi:hypothetical protein
VGQESVAFLAFSLLKQERRAANLEPQSNRNGHLSVIFRVARWFIFKTKIPIWVSFGEPEIGK